MGEILVRGSTEQPVTSMTSFQGPSGPDLAQMKCLACTACWGPWLWVSDARHVSPCTHAACSRSITMWLLPHC